MLRYLDLGSYGTAYFKRELARYKGIREQLLSKRFSGCGKAFTYYPYEIELSSVERMDSMLWNPRDRGATPEEKENLASAFGVISSFLDTTVDLSRSFCVQSDYFRGSGVQGSEPISVGMSEQVLWFLGNDQRITGGEPEVWTRLTQGIRSADEIALTINRGMVYPRPLGVLVEGNIVRSGNEGNAEAFVQGSRMLFLSAFGGQWPVFLTLTSL